MTLRHRTSVLTRASLLAACVALGACSDRSSPYHIGIVLDEDGMRGARQASERVNINGGINGHLIVLVNAAGAGSTKARVALETAERVASDPTILAVVGHTNSSASLAASQVYNARHLVQIAPTSSSPLYTNAGPYSFRLVGSDVHQGVFLATQVLERSPRPRTAVLFVNDDYGRPLRGVLVARLHAAGLDPVYDSPYSDISDNAEVVTAMARTHPDMLIWIGRAYDYGPIKRKIDRALPQLVVLASDGFSGGDAANDTLHFFDGISYVRLVDVGRVDSSWTQMRAKYAREKWGVPTDQAVLSYDAVMLLAEAIRHAGPNREAIRDWLSHVGRDAPAFEGMSGTIAFPSGGDRRPQYFINTLGGAVPKTTIAGMK
ncbi:MAG: ABC transporter substrate-binding protein [bacterium]